VPVVLAERHLFWLAPLETAATQIPRRAIMKSTIDMAREAWEQSGEGWVHPDWFEDRANAIKAFEDLIRAHEREKCQKWFDAVTAQHKAEILAEREACAKFCEEFARKWWKIHCDSNLHYSSTLRAHQDFCALQAAIRARAVGNRSYDRYEGETK
jgi:hypothetical protein